LWMAEYEDQLVAGNIFFCFKGQAISWSGVMRRSHAWLHPSVALQHASIKDACTCGCREYHFGPSLSFQSVERFKEQFGSERREYRNWAALTPLGRVLERLRPAITRACGSEERSRK
jgi:lipid II:glycine glycyltransferase (peptidoglycan interpeptide bridge formation enzyme)